MNNNIDKTLAEMEFSTVTGLGKANDFCIHVRGKKICEMPDMSEESKKNAKLIVSAVNNFEGLKDIAQRVKFMFGNEANYPSGTIGYNLASDAKALLNSINKDI